MLKKLKTCGLLKSQSGLAENVKKKKAFVKNTAVVWVCLNCGHKHVGKTAPKECPVCSHPQSYFQVDEKNY